ncbi:F-box related protein RH0 [Barthadenovirus mellis]|uniref:F-box related protein RH0 n=1 Tax=Passerine adenovirus 1 TaxID=2779174 RepID=A0A7L9DI91_9ADEN|nr:F-box related protein RH0 [Passerine adenovirus 1]
MILLNLSSPDVASFCLAMEKNAKAADYRAAICRASFVKRFMSKYDSLCGDVRLSCIRLLLQFNSYDVNFIDTEYCQNTTLSNHCFNCLLFPFMLLEPPERTGCYCTYHMRVWRGRDVVLLRGPQIRVDRRERVRWSYVTNRFTAHRFRRRANEAVDDCPNSNNRERNPNDDVDRRDNAVGGERNGSNVAQQDRDLVYRFYVLDML